MKKGYYIHPAGDMSVCMPNFIVIHFMAVRIFCSKPAGGVRGNNQGIRKVLEIHGEHECLAELLTNGHCHPESHTASVAINVQVVLGR